MHWTWRAMIASVAGGGFFAFVTWWLVTHPSHAYQGDYVLVFAACVLVPIITVVVYRWLSVAANDTSEVRETRCRKCQHILRGISEPRCPECGERI